MSKPWSAKRARAVYLNGLDWPAYYAAEPSEVEKHLARAYVAGIERTMLMLDERGLLASDHARDFLAAERARLLTPAKPGKRRKP